MFSFPEEASIMSKISGNITITQRITILSFPFLVPVNPSVTLHIAEDSLLDNIDLLFLTKRALHSATLFCFSHGLHPDMTSATACYQSIFPILLVLGLLRPAPLTHH